MTRPTDEQIADLRPGDVVTVRAVIVSRTPEHESIVAGKYPPAFLMDYREIMTIEPREIKVGDRVTTGSAGIEGIIKYVDEKAAFVAWDLGWHTAESLSTLRLIP